MSRSAKGSARMVFGCFLLAASLAVSATAVGMVPTNGILFSSGPDGSTDWDLYLIDPATGIRTLIYDNNEVIADAHWNRLQTQIVFVSGPSHSGPFDVYILDIASQTVQRLTTGGQYAYPQFYSDSVVWCVYRVGPGQDELHKIDVTTGVLTRLSFFNKLMDKYDFDDARRKLAYELRTPGNNRSGEVYVADIDSLGNINWAGANQLTHNNTWDGKPDITSDGLRVAFGHTVSGTWPENIIVMNSDGTGTPLAITCVSSSERYSKPVWSEDGSRIVCAYQNGRVQTDLFLLDPNAPCNVVRLTNTPGLNEGQSDWRMTPQVLAVSVDIKPHNCPNVIEIGDDEDDNSSQSLTRDSHMATCSRDDDHHGRKIKVAIVGTESLDVLQIDPHSVRLEGVPSLKWKVKDKTTPVTDTAACACTREGKDGFNDLVLKFPLDAVLNEVGSVADGDEIALTLTGELLDGTSFEGSDCITIRIEHDDDADRTSSSDNMTIAKAENEEPTLFNYPNPFNPSTEIFFSLPTAANTSLKIYNITGQLVATLVDGFHEAGRYSVRWDGTDARGNRVASGIYLYRLQVGITVATRKMVILK